MRKRFLTALWIIPALCSASAQGAPQIKNIKIAISNPSDHARKAADIVIPIAQLRKIAPDLTPGSVIVTASDASTLEQDALYYRRRSYPLKSMISMETAKGMNWRFKLILHRIRRAS
jgi:hypothetical protein